MHKTLARQIHHALGESPNIPPELQELFESISVTYDDFDLDRSLIERSLEISSTELKEFISLLQATLDSTDEGILVTDNKGKITNYNKRLTEVLEIQNDTSVMREMTKLVAFVSDKVINPEIFIRDVQGVSASIHTGDNNLLRFKDGRTVEVNSKLQLLEGESVGVVWSFQDVTMLLKSENELRSKIEALERLNNVMIDRELKMVELKKKIRSLEERQTDHRVENTTTDD